MDITASWTSVFILFVMFVIFAAWHVEDKIRQALREHRLEQREELSALRAENRELRYKLSERRRELDCVEKRVARLESQR